MTDNKEKELKETLLERKNKLLAELELIDKQVEELNPVNEISLDDSDLVDENDLTPKERLAKSGRWECSCGNKFNWLTDYFCKSCNTNEPNLEWDENKLMYIIEVRKTR